MSLRTIASLGDLRGKRVIVRCDLNVPVKHGEITDDGRIRASMPTIEALVSARARVVVTSHLGRPDGKPDEKFSLKPVATRLGELLGKSVAFAKDCIGSDAEEAVEALGDGDVALLENLRFHGHETTKDDSDRKDFARKLAKLGDAL